MNRLDVVNAPKPNERFSRAELRYRIADAINDRLKAIPYLHTTAKATMKWLERRRDRKRTAAARRDMAASTGTVTKGTEVAAGAARPDLLPFPPLEMRRLVGPTELDLYDNPSGALVYPWLPAETYEKVFDFGCGCGRVARQLILQRPVPATYVGIDLHKGMIEWCQQNLSPVAPNFHFYHHDVFNVAFNPGHEKPLSAPFPAGDSQFTLVNALSVFTHLTQEQAEYYLRECARVLLPTGVLHASWFLFDKADHPMMDESNNALYVSYVDPSAAVIFDRTWLRNATRALGLKIFKVIPPGIRGYQWSLLMTPNPAATEVELPPDAAPRGVVDSLRIARALPDQP
jgi:SAM-dependent methyltransferase